MNEEILPACVAGLHKNYGKIKALRGVDLEIRRGELVALLGANGAGKTTIVRTLLGLVCPDAGRATIFGGNPRDRATRARCGAMLQIARVPETLRVREHIELFSSYYRHPMTEREVIDATGLRGCERRLYGQLSGGQQRRLLFGLAICGNPDLLILDEPTVGLDVEARRALWNQIRGFLDAGRSVLLTTHYLAEAEALADRVAVIHHGAVVATGTTAEIRGTAATLEDAFVELLEAS